MMNMNPKAVAQDAGTLITLLDTIGDQRKAKALLDELRTAAQSSAESLDKMMAERKALEAKTQQLKVLESQLEQRRAECSQKENDLNAREAALKQKESEHDLRLKRLRDAVG